MPPATAGRLPTWRASLMARVDFAFGAPDRLLTACEVVAKHYLANHPVVVYSQNARLLERFDQLLWKFEPTAFVPHTYADDPLAAQTPVLLTSAAPQPSMASGDDAAWLLNLDEQCPATAGQFERILEIVPLDDDEVRAARQRWKHYKAEGHTLHAHNLSESN